MTEGGNSPVVNGGVADLQLDHETTETTRSLGSKSNTQILGLTRDTQFGVSVATITTFVTVDAFTPLGERYYDNHNTYRTGKAHQPD